MRVATVSRSSKLLMTIAIANAGCSAAASPLGSAAASPVGPASPAATALTSTAEPRPTMAALSPDAWLVVGRAGAPGFEVIQASTAERVLDLPAGAPARPDWGRMATASPGGSGTIVRDIVVQPGFGGPEVSIDGAWRLPTLGYDPTPVGLSLDGTTIVLVPAERPSTEPAETSRFAVLSFVPFGEAPRIIELAGSFEYDALSPDGRTLYVVEHLSAVPGGRYQVRAVDVATSTLKDGIIADKRNPAEQMAGWPIAQLQARDGRIFTLYRGVEHPFVHALDSVQGFAVCIDLPASGAGNEAAALDWGLAASMDERSIFAVNATLGLAVDIDPIDLSARRSVAFEPVAASPIVLAKFGHIEGGPVGRRVVLAPDGETAYAAGAGGITAVRTRDLTVADRYLEGRPVSGLGMTPDGSAIFALLTDGGRIVELIASTGEIIGEVPAAGYDRLVAVMPW
jgi:hypothetical protein